MRGLSSNQIISIAFFLTAIFISLALTGIPALISNRDAEMPSFYQEGMTKAQVAAAAATKAAAKPPPIVTVKKAATTKPVKCSSNQTLTNGICVTKQTSKVGALSVKATGGKQSASLSK